MAPQGCKHSPTKAEKAVRRPLPDPNGFIRPLPTVEMIENLKTLVNTWANARRLNEINYIDENQLEHLFDILVTKLPENKKDCDWSAVINKKFILDALYKVYAVHYCYNRKNNVAYNTKYTYEQAKKAQRAVAKKQAERDGSGVNLFPKQKLTIHMSPGYSGTVDRNTLILKKK